MAHPGNHIVVHMVDAVRDGQQFYCSRQEWPLHVTVAPWFTVTPDQYAVLRSKLGHLAGTVQPFTAQVGSNKYFGVHNEIPVNVIVEPQPFRQLQSELVTAVRGLGGRFESEQWLGAAYRPHITHHGEHRRFVGDSESVATISLVQVDQDRLCTVVETYNLGAADSHETTA